MAESCDYEMQTFEDRESVFQLASDDEESSDEEYVDRCKKYGTDSITFRQMDQRSPVKKTRKEDSQRTSNPFCSSAVFDKPSPYNDDLQGGSGSTDSSDYVNLDIFDNIEDEDIAKLLMKFQSEHYSVEHSNVDSIHAKCRLLFERDYICEAVDNFGGNLCSHYPVRLIVPVAKKTDEASSESFDKVDFDKDLYVDGITKSTSCRVRKRFVAPVIMFDGKFVCRAGTITVRKTAAFETARKTTSPRSQNVQESPIKRTARNIAQTVMDVSSRSCEAATQLFVPDSIRKLRDVDAKIIRDLKIQYIIDLMIEDRKKFKNVRVSSSEKINTDIYCDCNIEQMPYPGCKFFRRYHEANRTPEGLIFDWNRPDANTALRLTEDPFRSFPNIEWDDYKEWDVIELTKKYMKIILLYLAKGNGGLLVHCVSGWDRTPLFISLLRVSLWADGIVHQSLDSRDMAYLTLAYDWYLFGHDLPSRLKKKEEIMHFCFKFLPYIVSDEFSLTRVYHELPPEERGNGTVPDFAPGRRNVINDFSSYVLEAYEELITVMLE